MTRKKKNIVGNVNNIENKKISLSSYNSVENDTFYLQIRLSEHFDNFLNIYNIIKKEAEFSSDSILSNDLYGFKNVSSEIIDLIENSLDLNYNFNEDVKDYSDNDEEYIDNF